VAPLGGSERKVSDLILNTPVYRAITVAWCRDSSCLIAPDGQGEGKADVLFMIPLDGSEKRQLTFREGMGIDSDAAISPDGRSLVFRRDVTPFTSELYRVPLGPNMTPASEPVLLADYRVNATRPAWLGNSREIVFSSKSNLWRLDASATGSSPTRLPFVGLDGLTPTISGVRSDRRSRLVYLRSFIDTNVWRVDASAAGAPATSAARPAIVSTRSDHLPALSPDGKRLAFFSSRSGDFELWIGDSDGSNAVQLTSLKSVPGFARWSPNGQMLAFHSDPEGHADVLTIPASGGKPRILMPGPAGGGFPSFSRDGKWIYFSGIDSANQAGIFKMPVAGGTALTVVAMLGAVPIESYEGRDLFDDVSDRFFGVDNFQRRRAASITSLARFASTTRPTRYDSSAASMPASSSEDSCGASSSTASTT
jgi:eukaryotic-like serine/threonine-protein kinase